MANTRSRASAKAGDLGMMEAIQIVRLRHLLAAETSPAKKFVQQYYNDWVAFTHDCFNWPEGQGPTEYQDEIIANLQTKHRACVMGPHGLGKSSLASWVLLAFATTRDAAERDWKAPTTASAWRQLSKYLWPEIGKWIRRLKWEKLGREPFSQRTEQLSLSLKLKYGEAFAAASDTPEYMEGAHADSLLYIFDEAKVIPAATFDAAEGAFAGAGKDTGNEAFALVVSTPGEPQGRFYDIQTRQPGTLTYWCRQIQLDECLKYHRISAEWVEEMSKLWGRDSAMFANRVLGIFHEADEDGVIPSSWVEWAIKRKLDWEDRKQIAAQASSLEETLRIEVQP